MSDTCLLKCRFESVYVLTIIAHLVTFTVQLDILLGSDVRFNDDNRVSLGASVRFTCMHCMLPQDPISCRFGTMGHAFLVRAGHHHTVSSRRLLVDAICGSLVRLRAVLILLLLASPCSYI